MLLARDWGLAWGGEGRGGRSEGEPNFVIHAFDLAQIIGFVNTCPALGSATHFELPELAAFVASFTRNKLNFTVYVSV